MKIKQHTLKVTTNHPSTIKCSRRLNRKTKLLNYYLIFGVSNLLTVLIPTCKFKKSISDIALSSSMINLSNFPMPNNKDDTVLLK